MVQVELSPLVFVLWFSSIRSVHQLSQRKTPLWDHPTGGESQLPPSFGRDVWTTIRDGSEIHDEAQNGCNM